MNGGVYGAGLWAEGIHEAEHLIRLRGIGETIWGESSERPKNAQQWRPVHTWAYKREKRFQEQMPKVLHYLMLLCYVGLQSGRLQPWEIFCDGGAVHEVAHRLQFWGDDEDSSCLKRNDLVALVERIERRVPEFFEDPRKL